jgi:hypothetical protein
MNKRQKKKFDKKLRFKKYRTYKNFVKACKRINRNGRFYDPLITLNRIKSLSFPSPSLAIPFNECPVDQFIMASSARKRAILSGNFKRFKDVNLKDESSIYPTKYIEYTLEFAPRICGDKILSVDIVKDNV